MATQFKRWQDLKHPGTPEERARRKEEALHEYDRMGYAALRKARSLTQVELAKRLDISQGSVASLEARTDLHLSTLSKYIRAMGGRLEIQAVFPEATFNLEPFAAESKEETSDTAGRKPATKATVASPVRPRGTKRRIAAAAR